MPEDRVEALIALGIDPELAKRSLVSLDAMERGIKGAEDHAARATKRLREMAEAGEKLRNVGMVTAGMGAGILGPLTLAANKYAALYKGLEPQANAFNATLSRQQRVTESLGRSAATALTPIMNQVIAFEEKVAAFFSAHPEVMKIAVGAGAGLAIGGGTLMMAGTAISTISKSMELLNRSGAGGISGLAGGVGKLTVSVAALYAGAKLAETGLNAVGKATGDTRLEHYKLSDALKTGRQIIGGAVLALAKGFIDAKFAAQEMSLVAKAVWLTVKDKALDAWATVKDDFLRVVDLLREGVVKVINSLINFLADVIDKVPGMGSTAQSLRGKTMTFSPLYDPEAAARDQISRDRDTAEAAKALAAEMDKLKEAHGRELAGLAKFADQVTTFVETGSLGKFGDTIRGLVDRIKGWVGLGGGAGATGAAAISPEAVKAFIEYQRNVREMNRQQQLALAELKRQFDDQEVQDVHKNQAAIAKINTDFMQSELKAYQDFYREQAREAKQANKERLRLLEDLNDSLYDAAAQNDVVAFMNAQRQAEKDLRRQTEDADEATRQRLEDFLRQREEARQNREQALADQRTAFAEQRATARSNYESERKALLDKQSEERRLLQQNFALQLANLQDNLAGLSTLQNSYYATQTAAFAEYLKANEAALQQAVRNAYGMAGASSGTATNTTPSSGRPTGIVQSFFQNLGRIVPRLASGLEYVPRDMLALLHRGERVTPAGEAGGPQILIDMRYSQLSGGATQDDLNQVEQRVYSGVTAAIAAAGRS